MASVPPLPVCRYGKSCYRKNPGHFAEFSHPWLDQKPVRIEEEDRPLPPDDESTKRRRLENSWPSGSTILDLDYDCIQLVFGFLGTSRSYARTLQVCKRFYLVGRREIMSIKEIIMSKRNWFSKCFSEEVTKKWRDESAAQGIHGPFCYTLELLRRGVHPGVEQGIAYVDGLIPDAMRDELERRLDALAISQTPKDWHPGSKGMVHNLIHPSLYPFMRGITPTRDPVVPCGPVVPISSNKGSPFAHCLVKDEEPESIYQWLPAEVDVDAEGNATFVSDINNLDHASNPELYQLLGRLLSRCLPLLEESISAPPKKPERYWGRPPPAPAPRERMSNNTPESLRGRRLQVIVKAANYIIRPGQEYRGSWHVEGMPHERVVGTVIYYYSMTPTIVGDGLSFRRVREEHECEPDEDTIMEYTHDDFYHSSRSSGSGSHGRLHWSQRPRFEVENNVPVETIQTSSGRVMTWKNSLQHQVQPLSHSGVNLQTTPAATAPILDGGQEAFPAGAAVRKILLFWLIDPTRRVVSTADCVPPQSVLSREQALAHRLTLMTERKFHVTKVNDVFERMIEREYEFCEH